MPFLMLVHDALRYPMKLTLYVYMYLLRSIARHWYNPVDRYLKVGLNKGVMTMDQLLSMSALTCIPRQ